MGKYLKNYLYGFLVGWISLLPIMLLITTFTSFNYGVRHVSALILFPVLAISPGIISGFFTLKNRTLKNAVRGCIGSNLLYHLYIIY